MDQLSIRLLGSFHVSCSSAVSIDFSTDRVRALLAYLTVERGRAHRREHLASLLWPDQPDKRARHNLRQALSSLRQALSDSDADPVPLLLVSAESIQLNPAACCRLDVDEFVALADAIRKHTHRRPETCLPCLRRMEYMVELYQGEFLDQFNLVDSSLFEEWVLLKREWLHRLLMEALVTLADYCESRGDIQVARVYCQRQLELEPWREEAHRLLMRLLAREGQRSAALAQYDTCRRVLARELDVEPAAETASLFQDIRTGRYPQDDEMPGAPLRLPPSPTPFIGREDDRAGLADLLASPHCRLVTLVGPGGIGKTRLALQVAAEHAGVFADGIFWVSLGPLATEDLLAPAVAQVLQFQLYGKEQPQEQLVAYLRRKSILLVLDGAEHLPAASTLAQALLDRAPQVVLLVTSRQRLALREEWVYQVDGLLYPETITNGEMERWDAIALFVQNVRRAFRRFAPATADWDAMLRICDMVGGMPLALEMAAAWLPERSCADVAREIEQNLDLLASTLRNPPTRQRSVRATFEHSWDLLDGPQRSCLARLAVFRGSFGVQAAGQVAGATPASFALLAERSLLRPMPGNRYQLHGLLRQYAAEKLAEDPADLARAQAHHAAFYAQLLADLEADLKSASQELALGSIDRDIANVRRAWEWALDELSAGRLAACEVLERSLDGLYLFFSLRSWYQEGASLFGRAVGIVTEAAGTTGAAGLLVGALLVRQARCSEFTGPADDAIALYRRSLELYRELAAEQESALALFGLGFMEHIKGQYARARHYLSQSLTLYQQAGDQWGMANALSNLCLTARRQGTFDEARQLGLESLAIRREIGDLRGVASSLNNLGLVLCALGEYAPAEPLLLEAVGICRQLNHLAGAGNALTGLCNVALGRGDREGAVRFQEEALEIYDKIGDLWGVAIGYNNLGSLALDAGDASRARALFVQGVEVYRQTGIQAGLANTLNNLGQACYVLGEATEAARHFHESLRIAHNIGDLPIALEILTRAAALLAERRSVSDALVALAFALQQPGLLDETRRPAELRYEGLRAALAPREVAAAEARARLANLDDVVGLVLTALN